MTKSDWEYEQQAKQEKNLRRHFISSHKTTLWWNPMTKQILRCEAMTLTTRPKKKGTLQTDRL